MKKERTEDAEASLEVDPCEKVTESHCKNYKETEVHVRLALTGSEEERQMLYPPDQPKKSCGNKRAGQRNQARQRITSPTIFLL